MKYDQSAKPKNSGFNKSQSIHITVIWLYSALTLIKSYPEFYGFTDGHILQCIYIIPQDNVDTCFNGISTDIISKVKEKTNL